MRRSTKVGVAALAAAGIAWVFAPLLSLTLLSDDFGLIGMLRQRLEAHGGLTLEMLFAERWHDTFSNYRPMLAVSLAVDEALFGARSEPLHLVSLGLHALAAATLTALAAVFVARARRKPLTPVTERPERSGRSSSGWIAILAGMLFVVHPFHTESLAWIAARGDILSTLFSLIGLLTFERYRLRSRPLWLVIAWVAFAAALMSKESAILAPLLPLGLDLWWRRSRCRELRFWMPHVALILIVPSFLLARGLVIGGLVGEYGGASPFDPARLREFWQFLPQTILTTILPINPATPKWFVPPARWSMLVLVVVLIATWLPLKKQRLRGAAGWTAFWWLITIGLFFPLFASGKGVTHYRLFHAPTAAWALLVASGLAAARESGGWRRRVAPLLAIAIVILSGLTFRLDLGAYTQASSIVRRVEKNLERIRAEVPEPGAFAVLDTPTIVGSAPVFGAYLPMAFGRWLRPEDPIALVPWLGAEPLPFLLAAAKRPSRPGYVLRWDGHRLERVSAFLSGGPIGHGRERELLASPVPLAEGTWTSNGLSVPVSDVLAIRLELTEPWSGTGELSIRTSEESRFNPARRIPFTLHGESDWTLVPGPPGDWLLAGRLEGLQLRLDDDRPATLRSVRLQGREPILTIEPVGPHTALVATTESRLRLVIVLRRRLEIREIEGRGEPATINLPDRGDFEPAVETVPEIPVLWYVEALAPDGRVRARSLPRPLP